jgi:hypothetical protein
LKEPFDSGHSLALTYRDKCGTTHHSAIYVAGIQRSFLFLTPFAFFAPGAASAASPVLTRLTPEIAGMVRERLKDDPVELIQFDLSASPPNLLETMRQSPTGAKAHG